MTVQIRSTTGKLGCYSNEGLGGPTGRDELNFDELGYAHAQPESPNLDACDECSYAILRLIHGYDIPSAYGA